MIDIVKLANGNVAIYDSTSGDFINSLSPDIVEIECNVNGSVKIVQDNGSVEYIDPATVQNTEVVPAAAIAFSGDCADLAALLASDFFFVVSGGGVSDLATVLAAGNSAGANDIDLNGNDILNVNEITSGADLFLNPVGSIDCNGKTINMTGGEIHNVPLIHSQNNTDITIEGKGTGKIVLKNAGSTGNKGDFLESTGTAVNWSGLIYTLELINALTVDFYAPYDLKINTTTNIKNAPTITIQDDGAAYTLTNTIAVGSKITVTASVAGVVNLNITKA
jgi:hypothetical protein